MVLKKLCAPLFLLLWCGVALAQTPDAQSRYMPTGPAPEGGYIPYTHGTDARGEKVIGDVPAYLWHHGCGPTAAGMVIGYWDMHGCPMLIPGDSSTQTNDVEQAIATGNGAGTHYSDYSLPIDTWPDPILPDLSEPPAGDEHPSDCLADFMETSWSASSNYYGWAWFSDVDNSLVDYSNYANTTYGSSYIAASFSETWGDFTWEKFMAEIDINCPLVFLVDTDGDGGTDHFVTAIGYRDDTDNDVKEYACLDTWGTGIRWELFRAMGVGLEWGIYGATYYFVEPGADSIPLASGEGLVILTLVLAAGIYIMVHRRMPA
jgi:hypothetical protein